MSRAELEAAAAEKYPVAEGYGRTFNRVRQKQRAAYIQGRLDQAEADAQIAEDAPGSDATGYYASNYQSGYEEAQNRIAAAIREGVE